VFKFDEIGEPKKKWGAVFHYLAHRKGRKERKECRLGFAFLALFAVQEFN